MSPAFGVYPIADVLDEGDQISSTYEGRHLTLDADEVISAAGSGQCTKGLPVIFGLTGLRGVGIAFNTALTGLVAIDTEGIWSVDVWGRNDGGDVAVAGGDELYIDITPGSCVVSKIRDNSTNIPFGYALGVIATPGEVERIAVKVHWDPICHTLLDNEKLYFGDLPDFTMEWNETFFAVVGAAASKIVGEEFAIAAGALADGYGFKETNFNVSGQATAYVAGDSTWLNLEATFKAQLGGGLVTPHTDGIYMTADAEITGAMVALIGKFTDQMDESDMAWYTLVNLNLTQTIDAIYEVNNPALMGYVATPAANTIGSIPFFSTGGGGMKYIMLYSDPA